MKAFAKRFTCALCLLLALALLPVSALAYAPPAVESVSFNVSIESGPGDLIPQAKIDALTTSPTGAAAAISGTLECYSIAMADLEKIPRVNSAGAFYREMSSNDLVTPESPGNVLHADRRYYVMARLTLNSSRFRFTEETAATVDGKSQNINMLYRESDTALIVVNVFVFNGEQVQEEKVEIDSVNLTFNPHVSHAGKIPNIYVRRAIMAAMDTKLALEFYEQGTCFNIDYPMSMVSWAYPAENDTGALPKQSKLHDHTYMYFTTDAAAKEKIRSYMAQGGVQEGDAQLKITFTIAGSSITEHPTYPVFKKAAEILNDCGWNIEVKADSQALTKLSTGSLAVWAAAWGSTIDPDMYQVYHKNSTATSVYSWGYREIKADTSPYYHESDDRADAHKIIDALSDLIDQGRETMDQNTRKGIYEQALNCVLDLSVEMPVYQRSTLYAYNSKTIKGLNSNVNPYSSPLEKIWELEMVG